MKSKNESTESELSKRHIQQIIRRKMTQKSHGDKKRYKRVKRKIDRNYEA